MVLYNPGEPFIWAGSMFVMLAVIGLGYLIRNSLDHAMDNRASFTYNELFYEACRPVLLSFFTLLGLELAIRISPRRIHWPPIIHTVLFCLLGLIATYVLLVFFFKVLRNISESKKS